MPGLQPVREDLPGASSVSAILPILQQPAGLEALAA